MTEEDLREINGYDGTPSMRAHSQQLSIRQEFGLRAAAPVSPGVTRQRHMSFTP